MDFSIHIPDVLIRLGELVLAISGVVWSWVQKYQHQNHEKEIGTLKACVGMTPKSEK